MWDLYNREEVASAKAELRRGLAQTNDTQLINRYQLLCTLNITQYDLLRWVETIIKAHDQIQKYSSSG